MLRPTLVLLLAACGPTAATTPDASPPIDAAHAPDAAALPPDAAGCAPTVPPTEVCDGVDNDCNGRVDDVDVGGDGIFDCQRIGLLGLAGARASSNFLAWLESNGSSVERVQTDAAEPLTLDLLNRYDVVMLDRLVRTYTAEEAALLEGWVETGGGVMVMSGYTGAPPDVVNPNSLLVDVGLAYQPGLYSGPVTQFEAHPLTEGLSSVTFEGGFLVTTLPGVHDGLSTAVAHLAGGEAGIAQERGEDGGRVFVWGDEWIEFDSEWSTLPEIHMFWVNILGWLEKFR